MKKLLTVLLCICLIASCSLTALAADQPVFEDYATAEEYEAAYRAWYAAEVARAVQEESGELPTESAGVTHDSPGPSDPPAPRLDSDTDDKYPLGSYVDPAGNVYSPSGTLLSPPAAPAAEAPLEAAPSAPTAEETDTLTVIAGLVEDIAQDPPIWYVEDLRPSDPVTTVPDGLKALVASLFGKYTPVTTTAVVTETVGNDTHQYLVETVAPGAAGVDYEWLSGVFLFGILLFCLMKLLGGVLK